MLANIYLDRLDQAWQADHWRLGELTRYADDLAIVGATRQQAEAALDVLRQLLCELGLELAAAKTGIVDMRTPAEGFDFLGDHFRVVPTRRNPRRKFAACWPSRSAVAAARDRIRALTPLERVGLPTIMVVQDLNRFLRGGVRTFGMGTRPGSSTTSTSSFSSGWRGSSRASMARGTGGVARRT